MFVVIFFLASFGYRFLGVTSNHPFWVDEFSTANQAILLMGKGLSVLQDKSVYFELNKLVPTLLTTASFLIFGISEWSTRIPFVILGSFVPPLVYIIAKNLFGHKVALSAGILATTSYFMITWSRQARGYVLIELLVLVTLLFYHRLLTKIKIVEGKLKDVDQIYKPIFALLACGILGFFTHPFYYILIIAIALHLATYLIINYTHRNTVSLSIVSVAILIGVVPFVVQGALTAGFLGRYNNVWYYHSFLWREYGLIFYLGLIGLGIGLLRKPKFFSAILLYCLCHLIFICFAFGPYVSRYILPIFPFIIIGVAITIVELSQSINAYALFGKKRMPVFVVAIILTAFFVVNGHKFVLKPKQFYSVNHDFREIALIDYDQIYDKITQKGKLDENRTAVIDTWADRAEWYLGNKKFIYMFRWSDGGLMKSTSYYKDQSGNKIISQRSGMGLVSSLYDLKKVQKKYPKGFIFIDDDTLPRDVIDYAEKNLKKELFLDHYSLDDNPYSKWPATLYSWGMGENGGK